MPFDVTPNPPRPEVTSDYYRTFTYQDVDHVPDTEFGYWPQTARRWLAEGMKEDLTEGDIQSMFGEWMDRHFGFDDWHCHNIWVKTHLNPAFAEEVIERNGRSAVCRLPNGTVAEMFEGDRDESSIPHFLKFPVETPADWEDMKTRHRIDDDTRNHPPEEHAELRKAVDENRMISISFMGPYGKLRDMMGFENLSYAFFEYPEMIHDMMDHWTELLLDQMARVPEDIPIDNVQWWEDMAGRNGPFVGPEMFREFLQPCYHAVMQAAKKRGCAIGIVDCDGNPHDIVANWMEEGVNIMFPLEVAAGVDPYAWREEFGLEMRLRGGVDKRALAAGPEAIDAELERLKPLLDQGGFIPHLDHLVPPDISYDNYCYYVQQKRTLIGK